MLHKDLKNKIFNLEKKAEALGFSFMTEELGNDSVLMVSSKTNKAAIIGVFEIDIGKEAMVSYLIDLRQWRWAELEGFSKDDIINTPDLKNKIFEFVPVSQIFGKLS